MIKIVYFDKPEKRTIQEVISSGSKINNKTHYIMSTYYGCFDNKVELAIVDMRVALRYTHFCPNSIYGPKWSIVLQEVHKNVSEFKKWENRKLIIDPNKEWRDVSIIADCYSEDHYVEHIEDIFKEEIEVIGYIEEN